MAATVMQKYFDNLFFERMGAKTGRTTSCNQEKFNDARPLPSRRGKKIFSRKGQFWKQIRAGHSFDEKIEPSSLRTWVMSDNDDNDDSNEEDYGDDDSPCSRLDPPSGRLMRSIQCTSHGRRNTVDMETPPMSIRCAVDSDDAIVLSKSSRSFSKSTVLVPMDSVGSEGDYTIPTLAPPSGHSMRSIQNFLGDFDGIPSSETCNFDSENKAEFVTTLPPPRNSKLNTLESNDDLLSNTSSVRSIQSDLEAFDGFRSTELSSNTHTRPTISSDYQGVSDRFEDTSRQDSWEFSDMDLSDNEEENDHETKKSDTSATSQLQSTKEQFKRWSLTGWHSTEQFEQQQYTALNEEYSQRAHHDRTIQEVPLRSPSMKSRVSTMKSTKIPSSRRRNTNRRSHKDSIPAASMEVSPTSVDAIITELVEFLTPNSTSKRKVYLEEFQQQGLPQALPL